MRVLIVEDDKRLAGVVERGLAEEGYSIDTVYDGEEAEFAIDTTPYDLVILDIMLPKKDGLEVCRELRAKKITVPVLMLTARDHVEDRVTGLDTGADDYLIKPFAFSELLARVRALLRREITSKTPRLQVGDGDGHIDQRGLERAVKGRAYSERIFNFRVLHAESKRCHHKDDA